MDTCLLLLTERLVPLEDHSGWVGLEHRLVDLYGTRNGARVVLQVEELDNTRRLACVVARAKTTTAAPRDIEHQFGRPEACVLLLLRGVVGERKVS